MPNMKITVILSDELNQRIRKYIFETWPDSQYGKLKEVVVQALEEFLAERDY